MPDIFISYSSKDKGRVELLAQALENEGFNIWWDSHLKPGHKFRPIIQQQLDDAKCVIVVWTNHSVNSNWVLQESSQALSRDALVPILFEEVTFPMPFGEIQNADLNHWKGEQDDPDFQALAQTLRRRINSSASKAKADIKPDKATSVYTDNVSENSSKRTTTKIKKTRIIPCTIKKHWKATVLSTLIITTLGVSIVTLDFKQLYTKVFGTPTASIKPAQAVTPKFTSAVNTESPINKTNLKNEYKKINTSELKEKLKEISNGKFTTDLLKDAIHILSYSVSNKYTRPYSEETLNIATSLKKYGLSDFHVNNDKGAKKSIQFKQLPLGSMIFSSIIDVIYEINYNNELNIVSIFNKNVKYPNIKTSLDGFSKKQIKRFMLNDFYCGKVRKKSHREQDIEIYIENEIWEYYEPGHKCYSNDKRMRGFGVTPMGREVKNQVYEILYDKLL